MAGPEVYVSPPAPGVALEDAPTGSGSFGDPFHSIRHAIEEVEGGGTVFLRAGQYIEEIVLTGIGGADSDNPIVVRPHNVDRVTIDATVPQFRGPTTATDWQQVGSTDEFVSTTRFLQTPEEKGTKIVSAGAFLRRTDPQTGRPRHTRLVSYDRREDLLSPNQLWPFYEDLADNPNMLGPGVSHEWLRTDEDGNDVSWDPPRYRPFVYMGPGIWFDTNTGPDGRRVHIRLAHTSNQIDGWPDYGERTDPRRVPLGLSFEDSHVLRMLGCSHLRFEHLTMRFGGTDTIRLRGCAHIVFDHLTVWAGSRAIRFESENTKPDEINDDIEVVDSVIDGGLPTWFFRSDRKDAGYRFFAPGEGVVTNDLGYATSGVLISARSGPLADESNDHPVDRARARAVHVHSCEISNGHDVSAALGVDMEFHHNWVDNVNDDGLIIAGTAGTRNAKIYCNVVTQTLTGLSFAGGQVGHVYIYRNLFDLRAPTLGNRPTGEPGQHSLRQGTFYKDGENEGPIDLFHNTCVVRDAGGIGTSGDRMVAAGFAHYRPLRNANRRRSFNNIFVAVYTQPGQSKAIAFLPPSHGLFPTDGNAYHRFDDDGAQPRFLLSGTGASSGDPEDPDDGADFPSYPDLDAYQNDQMPQERFGVKKNPMFRSFDPGGAIDPDADDFRLQQMSPAHNSPAWVPLELLNLDREAAGLPFIVPFRDRGCYRWDFEVLQVGVEFRILFPRQP